MPNGTELHVGFLAPQSKQTLFASLRFSFSKMACDCVFDASAMTYDVLDYSSEERNGSVTGQSAGVNCDVAA